MQDISFYSSPLGKILLASDGQGLSGLWFTNSRYYADSLANKHQEKEDQYLQDAKRWLDLYFAGEKPNFTPKLRLKGTAFQNAVWLSLLEIPYGHTVSYKEIAQKVSEKRDHLPVRAAAAAIGRNHISLIVPCHRVIGSNGNLTGYAAGIEKKKALLKLEGIDLK